MRGASGFGGLVGVLGIIITIIAISRWLSYPDLDLRPAGLLAVGAVTVLITALAGQVGSGAAVGVGVWIALTGTVSILLGALLDRGGSVRP